MTRIKRTDVIPHAYAVAARCHHQLAGDERVRTPRMYTASEHRDGHGMTEYLLTRCVTREGKPVSCLLAVEDAGGTVRLKEADRTERKKEEQMILRWCEKLGGVLCAQD